MKSSRSVLLRFVVVVGAGLVTSGALVSPAFANENVGVGDAVVGSLGLEAAGVDVDERTGRVSSGFDVVSFNGLHSDTSENSSERSSLALSYSQERVGIDGFHLGSGWGFAVTRVDFSNGIPTVFPASGGVFEADASTKTGLARYPQEDLKFSQVSGFRDQIEYGFVLESAGGVREYFSPAGFLLFQVDRYGNTVTWVWDENTGRLLSLVDALGNTIVLDWTDSGVSVHAPMRADGVTPPPFVVETSVHGVSSVTDRSEETTRFEYAASGLLSEVSSSTGVVTRVIYREPREGITTAQSVVVRDAQGVELSKKMWEPVGENLFTGFPVHANGEAALWSSGDGGFRYRTRVSDGFTHVDSTWNAMGLLVDRALSVSTSTETKLVREERLVYPGTSEGRVPLANAIPAQYALPVESTTVFRDGDRSRTVTEESAYDAVGRIIRHVTSDGTATTTTYDDTRVGSSVPVGLVTEQTVAGRDGTVSKTVNTITPDHTSIATTETLVGVGDALASTQTSFATEANGFVSEKTVVATAGTDVSDGPDRVTTRLSRVIDREARTITIAETIAADTSAESQTVAVSDLSTGLVRDAKDAVGRVTHTEYDPAGKVVSVTDPAGLVTTTSYEDHDRVTRVRTPDSVVTSTYVDALDRVVKTTNNIAEAHDGSPVVSGDATFERTIETRSYTKNGSHVSIVDALGRKTVSETDMLGRTLSSSLESGLTQVSVYDDVANTVTTGVTATPTKGLAGAKRTSTQYRDDAGRDVKTTGERSDGVVVPESTKTFDGLGRTVQSNTRDIQTRVAFNPDGTSRSTATTPLNQANFPGQTVAAERSYDITGTATNKTLVREPQGGAENGRSADRSAGVTRVLDAAGRTIRETDQQGGVTRFTHTQDGLIAERVEEASQTVTRNTYDPTTRVLTESITTRPRVETVARAYEHDPVTGKTLAVFDLADRVGTQVTYSYDVLGNVTRTTYPDGKTIAHIFDVDGRKTTTTDIAGNTTRYAYNTLGLVTRATQNDVTGAVMGDVAYEYDSWGRVTKTTRGNGVVTEYAFTSADEIASEKTVDRDGRTIFEGIYLYDSHGNLAQKATQQQHADTPDLTTNETTRYRYNAYDQLIESSVFAGALSHDVESPTKPLKVTQYHVGVTGNITDETVTVGETSTKRELEYNVLGQLVAITTNGVREEQLYDTAGNLVGAADRTTYTYSALNQQVTRAMPDGSVITDDYWATGKRKIQTDSSANTEFYWDGDTLMNEAFTHDGAQETSNDTAVSSYLFGITRAGRVVSGETLEYYVGDRHGSTVALTSNTGVPTISYEYSDYGHVLAHEARSSAEGGNQPDNRFQYSGEYTNGDGSQSLGVRSYAPRDFGFTTRDNAEQFNLYAYANANPITLVDPSGQTPEADKLSTQVISGAGLFLNVLSLASPYGGGKTAVALLGVSGFFGILSGTALGLVSSYPVDDDIELMAIAGALGGAIFSTVAAGKIFMGAGKAWKKFSGARAGYNKLVKPKEEVSPRASRDSDVGEKTALTSGVASADPNVKYASGANPHANVVRAEASLTRELETRQAREAAELAEAKMDGWFWNFATHAAVGSGFLASTAGGVGIMLYAGEYKRESNRNQNSQSDPAPDSHSKW